MNFFKIKYLSLVLFASASTGAMQANRYEDGNCCPISNCYECSCNPLYCGAWDLEVQGGVCPVTWRSRDQWTITDGGVTTNLFETPSFKHLFRTPWIVGGQIGYHWCDNVRLYVEFDYLQAKSKNNVVALTGTNITLNNLCTGKFSAFEAYFGGRYYFDRWCCDRLSFFLGAKIGLINHRKINFNGSLSVNGIIVAPGLVATEAALFKSNTQVSGGVNAGFDICFGGNWSLVITGEVVANRGPRGNSIDLTPTLIATATNLSIGKAGTELLFPVTAGIRYSF